jgi:VanZ family protein
VSRARGAWLLAIAWAALIFALNSRPDIGVSLPGQTDKIAHFGAYAVLGYLLAVALLQSASEAWFALGIGSAFGALDELHQRTVPGRTADIFDWVADSAGVTAGLLILLLARRLYHRRSARRSVLEPNRSS